MGDSYTIPERAWILYDLANSAFILIVVTTIMPLFFKDIAAAGMAHSRSTALWGYATAFASLLIALLAPFLGALADLPGNKKRLFSAFWLTGVVATLCMVCIGRGQWFFCLVLLVAAKSGFSAANLFYDSLLVDVTRPSRMNRVSAAGFAWGYLGSCAPFVACLALILLLPAAKGSQSLLSPPAARWSFVITAWWWALFTVPLLCHVRQRYAAPATDHPLAYTFRQLRATLRHIRGQRAIFLFLLAYFCYIDGVDTVIVMAMVYGREIGLGAFFLVAVVLAIQVLAFPFTLLYGRLAQKYSARNMILCAIGVYFIITLIGFYLPVMGEATRTLFFCLLAFLVASSQGGIQALSRSYFGQIIPKERAAEFFGFYNIFARFATILGPLLMALVGGLSGQSRYGILSLVLLFAAGFAILRALPKECEQR